MAQAGSRLNTEAPLRIALVHAADFGGGAERSVVSLHRGLRAAGHASTLFVGEQKTDEPGVVKIPYVRGIPGSRRIARQLERSFGWQDIYNPSFRRLAKLLEGRFDIVHFHSLWGSSGYADLSALPAITRRIPGVLTLRDYWMLTGHCAVFMDCQRWKTGCGQCPDLALPPAIPRDGTHANWLRKRRLIARSNLHVVTISDEVKQRVAESPIFAGKPVTRIYNGINLSVFRPAPPDLRQQQRRALGISEGEVVVLLAGQAVEWHRFGIATHHAVDAVNALQGMEGVRALVIGRSAAHVAGLLKVPSIVLPYQSEPEAMARCFQAADITLVSSEVETFGRIGAESQACGTPVVSFDSGGIPEVVPHGVGGLVVQRRDTAALAAALVQLAGDPALRRQFADGGRAHVVANFDDSHIVDRYLSLYRNVLARRDGSMGPGHQR